MDPHLVSPYEHILSAAQFDTGFLDKLFARTKAIEKNPGAFSDTLKGAVTALLFYEPSTRTRFSFESAIARLGGTALSTENARDFSSAAKGETLEDTIRVVGAYADFIILRHFLDDACERASLVSGVPIINAGSGKREHPTQALLDVYTIWKKFGSFEGLRVAVAGDLKRGRTANSLVYLLSQFPGTHFDLVAPLGSGASDSLKDHLRERDISYREYEFLDPVIRVVDVLYMTRIQKERFEDEAAYQHAYDAHQLSIDLVKRMKEGAIIMHPLPRRGEIPEVVDADPRAYYFKQARNGLFIRMALLTMLAKLKTP